MGGIDLVLITVMDKNDFPFYNTPGYKLSLCLAISFFFYFFIIFFLPFGVDNYNPNHQYTFSFFLEFFYFFIFILVISILNEFILRPLFFKKTSLKKIIIWSVWILYLLSTVVFFTYNILGNWHDFSFYSYSGFLVNVSVVLLFPLAGTFFFFRYRSLQHHIEHILTTKEEFVDAKQLINFKGQGSRDEITLSSSSFLYGRAQDNYVELFYVEKNQLKKFLIRSTLSSLVKSINNLTISRCHRSYMVNLLHVKAIKGANQEMALNLAPFDSSIPVSKRFHDSVFKDLRDLKNFG